MLVSSDTSQGQEAGTDNKYLVLEFAMVELMLHQDVMAKLQHEVRSIAQGQTAINEDCLTGMTYLRAVIKETLRQHPPSPLLLPHLSIEDCDVDRYTIPAGTTVLVMGNWSGPQLVGDSPAAKAFLPLLLPLLVLFLLLRYFTAGAGSRARLPPSPSAGLPLIGHVHLVGALPHVSLRGLAARRGCEDLMTIRLGAVQTLVASSARAAQAVLRTHDQAFASRVRSICGDVLTYGPSDVVFAPYGERWRQSKKLVTTHLLSAKKVQFYRAAREDEVELVINKIRDAAVASATVDMSEVLSKFTNDMVCRAVAGRSFRLEGRDRVFRELIDQTFAVLGGFNLENFYPGLAKAAGGVLMWPARRRAERLRDRWDELLDKLIDKHMSEVAGIPAGIESGGGEDQHDSDFIHVLLSVQEEYGLTRDSIKAGTDTTYLVLEFIMAELMLHQDVMAKLQDEVRNIIPKGQIFISEDNLVGMAYLKAVIKETLRLHPPVPLLLPHLSQEDCIIDSYTIPGGMSVLVNAWAINREPNVWDAADEFMPERFVHMGDIGGVDFRGMDFQFLPFGSGRRICPGINFALTSIEIMLANLMFHFDWELPRGVDTVDMAEVFGLTVSRKEWLLLNPRSRGDITK
ncbi:indole-2-monooxygenase [Dichanthelium oligosanthes]|uniref:Indole-2-monooxygenase n=1 Tax=Dichanthelium oligosanthes TaxID=888268 RepID=A0A1E5VDJ8_9POAL|nr:indole-2-monooxygenase [Dichanthelium oligosanthes]